MAPGIDCHSHLIDPSRFPFAAQGGYRPRADETGTREAYMAILKANDLRHALLVQPSCYATDNGAILDALAWRPGFFKAIGVFDVATPESKLERLAGQGFIGA